MVLPLSRLHDAREELEALRRDERRCAGSGNAFGLLRRTEGPQYTRLTRRILQLRTETLICQSRSYCTWGLRHHESPGIGESCFRIIFEGMFVGAAYNCTENLLSRL